MPTYLIDAATDKVPVFGVDAVISTDGDTTLAVVVQDVSNIEFTGERVTAKDGEGKDQARVYYNIDYKSCTLTCWPVGATETAAKDVGVLFKHGTRLQIASTKYPDLVGIWRVTQCQNTASNTDKKMVSISLEWSITQSWT